MISKQRKSTNTFLKAENNRVKTWSKKTKKANKPKCCNIIFLFLLRYGRSRP